MHRDHQVHENNAYLVPLVLIVDDDKEGKSPIVAIVASSKLVSRCSPLS